MKQQEQKQPVPIPRMLPVEKAETKSTTSWLEFVLQEDGSEAESHVSKHTCRQLKRMLGGAQPLF